ncbi:uncharacterized protein MELLADRAFT_78094 [Melampsora larici-populina 98AG31]|uniref:Histone-lysine N-methyltransferase, H3 lysine-36 specific n=1 Tax=Melampsora larici-populina (strain 98AG31 / pathotype 3-4-7) TaxID=747676 RepID=F4RQ42_MELLP|nr:uncharacterized protein MELLADRAFT_78094 [Melampsora larici-populina 98AG31]EGG05344.1 hypothetical protein MELLADRAFT_78094 [Melampsora larici-populina 98AG31]
MDRAAHHVSPTITGGMPALDITCTPENGRTSQSDESRDSLTLVTPGSPIDLVLDSPMLHNQKSQEPHSQPLPETTLNDDSLNSTHPRLEVSTTPEVLPELLKDPTDQDSSPHDIHISLTPSTSSGHDSGRLSPIAPRDMIIDSVNDISPDSSNIRRNGRGRKPKTPKPPPPDIQLIHNLPEATTEAIKTFDLLEQNWYQFKGLGKTKMLDDMMVCECSWSLGKSCAIALIDPSHMIQERDDPNLACGLNSGCINYLTQVECLKKECRCLQMCQNQRFQKRQYAPIEIVATERKGFGVRLKSDVPADSFVYEYIGEVVGEKAFQRRIKEYAQEGLKHFYFMQLQREEYIDATKKGGLGRFLNHSCNPNCYIGKWVVGRHLRMGIFTKRAVKGGEELTFNYNVDRYGQVYEAQECFCGEAQCVGFLGGKTQTDVGAMDELYIDALGITADVEEFGLKGSKTKKGKKMDVDYNPIMKCIPLKDVPKVASAIRQSISNQRILSKLLRRVLITEDPAVQKQLMRLHGFSMMSMVLNEYLDNQEIVKTTLEILLKWPLITKNKIVSTNIEETVMKLSSSPSEMIQTLAAELVDMWVDLSVSYRIPKAKDTEDVEGSKRKSDNILDHLFSKRVRRQDSGHNATRLQLVSETKYIRPEAAKPINVQNLKPENIPLPFNWAFEKTPDDKVYFYHIFTRQTQWTIPTVADVAREEKEVADFYARQKAAAVDVNDIVAKTKAEAEAVRLEAEARQMYEQSEQPQQLDYHQRERHDSSTKHLGERSRAKSSSASTSNAKPSSSQTKDKKMLRLFSTVVVRTMSRYKDSLEHDQFKKRAKELTNILCQKEAKSSNYMVDDYDKLTPGKEAKIISFVKDWTAKLLARKGLATSTSSSSRNSHETSAPASAASLAIFRISEPTPMSAPLSHVRDTPFTPDSKSSSDLSNGNLDSNLLREINGESKPDASESVEDLETRTSDLADENHSTTTALTIPDQLQDKKAIQTMSFDKAPPPPPPCSILQSAITQSDTTLAPTSVKLANGEMDVVCSGHPSQVQPSLSMPSPISPIDTNISHQPKNVLSRLEPSPTTILLCDDAKSRTSSSTRSPPLSP